MGGRTGLGASMPNGTARPYHAESVRPHREPKAEEVLEQLQYILVSPAFHGSKRCQQFLKFVCEKALSGEAGGLKERTIAAGVFGRQLQSDSGEDTIVRVGAREVRKRLAQYYVSPEGQVSQVRIELPPGSYVPEFQYAISDFTEELSAESQIAPVKPPQRRRVGILLGAAALGVLLLVAILGLTRQPPVKTHRAFDLFWDPVFATPDPMLLAVAHPIVYHPSPRALKLNEELAPSDNALQRPLAVPRNLLDGSDWVPTFNQYVGFGDMVVATEVTAMLAQRGKQFRLRMASGVEMADLRNAPTLLIGAVTNRWTVELQRNWRFQFVRTPQGSGIVVDTATPRREWAIPAAPDGVAPEDYVLISRIPNSLTGGLVMVAAGLKQFGTEAAGRELVDAERLSAILNKLPQGWEMKNLQLVLHSRVINSTAGIPELVAWHLW